MRRSDRQVTDPGQITEMLRSCLVMRVAMQDGEGLYIVPVNYGFALRDGQLVLYFHGAYEGRKAEAMRRPIPVAFEMDGGMELVEAREACAYGCRYFSVMGNGTARTVTDVAEKKRALAILMKHQTGRDFEFTDSMADSTAVFAIDVDDYTAKQRR